MYIGRIVAIARTKDNRGAALYRVSSRSFQPQIHQLLGDPDVGFKLCDLKRGVIVNISDGGEQKLRVFHGFCGKKLHHRFMKAFLRDLRRS